VVIDTGSWWLGGELGYPSETSHAMDPWVWPQIAPAWAWQAAYGASLMHRKLSERLKNSVLKRNCVGWGGGAALCPPLAFPPVAPRAQCQLCALLLRATALQAQSKISLHLRSQSLCSHQQGLPPYPAFKTPLPPSPWVCPSHAGNRSTEEEPPTNDQAWRATSWRYR